MAPFIQGLELSERFYREAVAPILARRFPQLVHSAALIGPGSDVLGFDTPQSMDHDWGPRLLLFLSEAEAAPRSGAIAEALRRELRPRSTASPRVSEPTRMAQDAWFAAEARCRAPR